MAEKPWEEHPELSDLEIIIGKQKIKCHKIILARRSPMFQQMFKSKMKENLENKLTIEDTDEATFSDFLCHCYEPFLEIEHSKLTIKLFEMAIKYLVTSLMQQFGKNSRKLINNDNAIDFAILSSEIDSNDGFLTNVVKYILSHYSTIKKQSKYNQMISIPKVSGMMIDQLRKSYGVEADVN